MWFRVPYIVVKEEDAARHARYGYTWRGIKRERDREYSIGAGEYLVVDLETNEVLGVKRGFKISGHDKNTSSGIGWENARPCEVDVIHSKSGIPSLNSMRAIVRKTLIPIPGINEQYIPESHISSLKGSNK